jgi:hypothetical protein
MSVTINNYIIVKRETKECTAWPAYINIHFSAGTIVTWV